MSAGSLVIEEAVRIPSDVFDLEGFLRFVHSADCPQRGRFSFLGGEVNVDMSPEELLTHNCVRADVGGDLGVWIQQADRGRLLSAGALLVNTAADLATEPDMMFCRWDTFRQGRVRPAEWIEGSGQYVQLEGSPDLVLEVVSATSVIKDTEQLPALYLAAGIQEYFVLGDFSKKSSDSRFWTTSVDGLPPYALPESNILGVVTHIYWPPSRWRILR